MIKTWVHLIQKIRLGIPKMLEQLSLNASSISGELRRRSLDHRAGFSSGFLIGLYVFLLAPLTFAQESPPQAKYKSVAPKSGERCIICDVPLSDKDITLMVRGRRVPLKNAMVDSFMNNQEKYFSELQPKSALFQENLDAPSGVAQGGIGMGWFLFGSYVLLALIFGGISGYAAVSKGLPAIPNFFIGLSLSVFGMLFVVTRPPVANKKAIPPGLVKVPVTNAPTSCPKCGGKNHPTATSCAQCRTELTPSYESEVSKA